MNKRSRIRATLAAALLFSGTASATITYEVDRTVGDGWVKGTMTTDGTLGDFEYDGPGEFVEWNLVVYDGIDTIDISNAVTWGVGRANFRATKDNLFYDFTAPGYLIFETDLPGEGVQAWHLLQGRERVFAGVGYYDRDTVDDYDEHLYTRTQGRSWSTEQIIGTAIPVPEPGALALLTLGLATLGGVRRTK